MKTILCKVKLGLKKSKHLFYKLLIEEIFAIKMNPGKPMRLEFN